MPSSSSSSASSSRSSSPGPQNTKNNQRNTESTSDTSSSDSASDSSDSELEQPSEPVLSHAALRKQKRKLQTQGTSTTVEEATDVNKNDTSKPPSSAKVKVADTAQLKRQNSVWIGNLSFKTTPDALRRFFDGVGEITRIHMPTKSGGDVHARNENRGFAYVDFATPDAKITAIALSENPLEGRRLLIKDGGDFTGRPAPVATTANTTDASSTKPGLTKTAQKILSAQKQPPAPTLFLGNLGFETTDDSIRGLLDAHRPHKPPADPQDQEG
ncbi:hypothetical protein EW146_g1472, partial [Bondarzewia mesenterica]